MPSDDCSGLQFFFLNKVGGYSIGLHYLTTLSSDVSLPLRNYSFEILLLEHVFLSCHPDYVHLQCFLANFALWACTTEHPAQHPSAVHPLIFLTEFFFFFYKIEKLQFSTDKTSNTRAYVSAGVQFI